MGGLEPEQQAWPSFSKALDVAENATYREIADCYSGDLRQALLRIAHPEGCSEIASAWESEINPPSRLASTARWLEFRRSILRMTEKLPDESELLRIMKQIEAMLDWRMTVPRDERFWKVGGDRDGSER